MNHLVIYNYAVQGLLLEVEGHRTRHQNGMMNTKFMHYKMFD